MLKLMTGYSMYFNKRYERTGKLYEGVFKSSLLDKDTYLKYIYSYIHLNPAKLQDKNWRENKKRNIVMLLNYTFSYSYSSIKEYTSEQFKIINPSQFPSYFKKPEDHKKELLEWLNFEAQKNTQATPVYFIEPAKKNILLGYLKIAVKKTIRIQNPLTGKLKKRIEKNK